MNFCASCGTARESSDSSYCVNCGQALAADVNRVPVVSFDGTPTATPEIRPPFAEGLRTGLGTRIGRHWDVAVDESGMRFILSYSIVVFGLNSLQTLAWWVVGAVNPVPELDTALNFLDWALNTALVVFLIRARRMQINWQRDLSVAALIAIGISGFDLFATLLRAAALDMWPNPLVSLIVVVGVPLALAVPLLFAWARFEPPADE